MSSTGKTVGTFEAKTKLAEILKRVENGERITITRRGIPIAEIVPAAKGRNTDARREAVAALLEFRKNRKLRGHCLSQMVEEGRRF